MEEQIAIRDAVADDMPFFFNSFLNHYKHSSPHTRLIPESHYYLELHGIVDRVLERKGNILKLCVLAEDPSIVFGYLWANDYPETIFYLYVKKAFRGLGIAKALMQAVFPDFSETKKVFYPFFTYDAGKITMKYSKLVFNPYLLDAKTWRTYQNKEDAEDLGN
jgi:GNAT superfamily N-acetyltransferase